MGLSHAREYAASEPNCKHEAEEQPQKQQTPQQKQQRQWQQQQQRRQRDNTHAVEGDGTSGDSDVQPAVKLPTKQQRRRAQKFGGKMQTAKERHDTTVELPVHERQDYIMRTYLEHRLRVMVEERKCLRCCLLGVHCICAAMDELGVDGQVGRESSACAPRPPLLELPPVDGALGARTLPFANPFHTVSSADARHTVEETGGVACRREVRFHVWMHFKERFRGSNTGKLLLHAFPGSQLYIDSYGPSLERFAATVLSANAQPDRLVLLLFPGDDAHAAEALGSEVPSEQLLRAVVEVKRCGRNMGATATLQGEQKQHGSQDDSTAGAAMPVRTSVLDAFPLLDVVVLDGTWSQARKMRLRFVQTDTYAHMLPVMLSPTELSRFSLRKQAQQGRISTVEACALLLEATGAGTADRLHAALELLQSAMGAQCHRTEFNKRLPAW